jgi:hypothetical protein
MQMNHHKLRYFGSGEIRLIHRHRNGEVGWLPSVCFGSVVSTLPPEYRWGPSQSIVIETEHGKPDEFSQTRVSKSQDEPNTRRVMDSGVSECLTVMARIGKYPY